VRQLRTIFGVKAADLEEARSQVEEITGLKAEPRESSDWGGEYYAFGDTMSGEYIRLINNRDVYDNEPVVSGVDEWPIALFINRTEGSPLLEKLKAASRYLVPATKL